MENGEWRMENGERRTEKERKEIFMHQLVLEKRRAASDGKA